VRLRDYRSNINSQNGEDGMLAKLFDVVGIDTGYFVEFGAWDGRHLSNVFALGERGWRGCLIEADPKRFEDLLSTMPDHRFAKLCRFVAPEGRDSLDSILADVGAPERFELLSIDIDSDDLAIWRSMKCYRPRCVVIEYNPTIPFDCYFENPPGQCWGNSALSIVSFADAAEYALVGITKTNLVFYDRRSNGLELIEEARLSEGERGSRYFWGYDGSLLQLGSKDDGFEESAPEFFDVPWTGFRAVQPIPKLLRGYHDRRTALTVARRGFSLVLAGGLRPGSSLRDAKRRLRRC